MTWGMLIMLIMSNSYSHKKELHTGKMLIMLIMLNPNGGS